MDRLLPGDVARGVTTDSATSDVLAAFADFISLMHRSRLLNGPGVPGRGVLVRLAKTGPLRMSELADAGNVDQSTMSRQIHRLEADGLVERMPDPEDRRAQLVSVTPAGLDEARRVIQARLQYVATLIERWSQEDRVQFARLLNEFVEAFDAHLYEGHHQ